MSGADTITLSVRACPGNSPATSSGNNRAAQRHPAVRAALTGSRKHPGDRLTSRLRQMIDDSVDISPLGSYALWYGRIAEHSGGGGRARADRIPGPGSPARRAPHRVGSSGAVMCEDGALL